MNEQQLLQDLEAIQTIVTWIVGVMTPILLSMAGAIGVLWRRNRELEDKQDELYSNIQLKQEELQTKQKEEMKQMWEMTLNAFVEQTRVMERLSSAMSLKRRDSDAGA